MQTSGTAPALNIKMGGGKKTKGKGGKRGC